MGGREDDRPPSVISLYDTKCCNALSLVSVDICNFGGLARRTSQSEAPKLRKELSCESVGGVNCKQDAMRIFAKRVMCLNNMDRYQTKCRVPICIKHINMGTLIWFV